MQHLNTPQFVGNPKSLIQVMLQGVMDIQFDEHGPTAKAAAGRRPARTRRAPKTRAIFTWISLVMFYSSSIDGREVERANPRPCRSRRSAGAYRAPGRESEPIWPD